MPEQKGRLQIDGSTLKIIAIITMAIDHIGAVLIEVGLLGSLDIDHLLSIIQTDAGSKWYMFDLVLRIIGRIAFPIFCFLLVEGFFHTRDRKKYALRLLAFAAISEIPFDLAVHDQWFSYAGQNVFFTLFIGIVMMQVLEQVGANRIMSFLTIIAACVAAVLLNTDYNAIGIVMILIFYVFHGNRRKSLIWGGVMAGLESLSLFGAAALSVIPISKYNGERGRVNMKYFFYAFYPAHLLLLYVIRILFVQPL